MTAPAVWILGGVRTPFVRAGSSLGPVPVTELGRLVLGELLARHDLDPGRLDEVVLGNCAQPANAMNVARVAALRAGIPERVPGLTVHRSCASGMEAVAVAAERIRLGRARLVLAGGMESMSGIPVLYPPGFADWHRSLARARHPLARLGVALRLRPALLRPRPALRDALHDPVCGLDMGGTAELLAREFDLPRELQDGFALRSHERAVAARERLREEIVPVFPPPSCVQVRDDSGPRDGLTLERLAGLAPVFDRRNGTVTAGNACPVTDGAVALLVADEETAAAWPTPPLGRVRAWAVAGVSPRRMGLGPVHAMARALDQAGLALEEVDLFELHEAFAAQALACLEAARSTAFARAELGRERALGEIPSDRLNVNGGAIALGHPVGASGARMLLTLLLEMRRRGVTRGLAALCVGGGQGSAFVLERDA
jgi:acetyl-CoA acetyltransferase family protein